MEVSVCGRIRQVPPGWTVVPSGTLQIGDRVGFINKADCVVWDELFDDEIGNQIREGDVVIRRDPGAEG